MLLFGKNSGRVEYLNFYDIRVDDPENMTYPNDYDGSIASYHFHYLKKFFE
jgi:hypothetical protein